MPERTFPNTTCKKLEKNWLDVTLCQYKKKCYMSSIKPRCFLGCNEKLRSIGIFSCIGHRQPASSIMLQFEVLICKPFSIDTTSTSSISVCEVTPLNHKVLNDSMKERTLVSIAWTLGKLNKVFDCLGDCFSKQTNLNSASFYATDFNVKPYL